MMEQPESTKSIGKEEEEEGQVISLPEGIKALFIQNKYLEKYGLLLEANGVYSDENVVPYKILNKDELLEECAAVGFMCDFHVIEKELKDFEGDDVLLVSDKEQKYGERFYICLSPESRQRELEICEKAESARKEKEAKEKEEEERRLEEDRRIANAVYVDKQPIARKYISATSEESAQEVDKLSVKPERPLLKYAILRDTSTLGLPCNFGDREADNDKYLEHRSHKNPDFELQRREKDTFVQAAPAFSTIGTQTKFYQKQFNKYTQYQALTQAILNSATPVNVALTSSNGPGTTFLSGGLDPNSRPMGQDMNADPISRGQTQGGKKQRRTMATGRTTAAGTEYSKAGSSAMLINTNDHHHLSFTTAKTIAGRRTVSTEDRLGAFLRKSMPLMEEALQHNETMDIFQDAFWSLLQGTDEDSIAAVSGADTRAENELKQLRTFNDIQYSKNMSLACVEWHPTLKGMLAVAPVANLTFEQRVAISRLALSSYILLWDFTDLIHPRLLLESPQEIFCFAFNSTQPRYIVAGGNNGQVLLWDIETQVSQIVRRQRRSAAVRSSGGISASTSALGNLSENCGDDDDSEEELEEAIPPAVPLAVSAIDQTHKRGVADILWLPPECQVDYRGQLLDTDDTVSHQFVTVAGDGQLLFWDVRYKEIAEGKLPTVGRRLAFGSELKPGKEVGAPPWQPLYRVQLKRVEGVGELCLCKFLHTHNKSLSMNEDKDEATAKKDRRSEIVCGSEEGEIIIADWRGTSMIARNANDAAATTSENDQNATDDAPDYVRWTAPDHYRPTVALDKSPFFDDLVLSIGDWNFQLWKIECGLHKPVYSSPQSASPLTAGCWSPTRPGVVYTARADGALDVWDIPDSSHRPSLELMIAPTRVTSLKFLKPLSQGTKQHLLAVGDKAGNLHVFDVPRSLWRPIPNEKSAMASFIEGELDRVIYLHERAEARRKQQAAADDASNAINAPGGAGSSSNKKSTPRDHTVPNTVEHSRRTTYDESNEFSIEELNALNEEYIKLQAQFAEEMGITLQECHIPKIVSPPAAQSPKSIKSAASSRR